MDVSGLIEPRSVILEFTTSQRPAVTPASTAEEHPEQREGNVGTYCCSGDFGAEVLSEA
jgi:hypothetical protein